MSAVGTIAFARRYWKCTCGADGSYAADDVLGVAGQRYTKAVQRHCCRLAAETAFASASGLMHELLGVDLCPETVRTMVEGHGRGMARFQADDAASAKAFREAAGEVRKVFQLWESELKKESSRIIKEELTRALSV